MVSYILNYLKHNLKLALKSVTYHFKQYFCFYVAILIVETMFGIIVMSTSNNIYQYKANTMDDYDYHISLTGLTKGQKDYLYQDDELLNDERYSFYDEPNGDLFNVYVYMDEEMGTKNDLLQRFTSNYLKRLPRAEGSNYTLSQSPLFNIGSELTAIRLECALKLFVLGIVSILVIMLLYNIRINHFKFTYGIYMSFGADCKQLFTTCVWEIFMIAVLVLIPAGGIATLTSYLFYELAEYKYHFAPQLALYAILFMIPVVMIAIFLPIKAVASKPPLKLLLAEDNSNLVTPPRISVQLLGKKFPRSYEGISMARFRRYSATLILSSVVFSSLFVCTSFFRDIYKFNMDTEKQEYTVHFNQEEIVEKVWEVTIASKDVTLTFREARNKAYGNDFAEKKIQRVRKFESYYDSTEYIMERSEANAVVKVTRISDNKDVTEDYEFAKAAALKDGISVTELNNLEKYLNDARYQITHDERNNLVSVLEKQEVEKIRYEGEELTPERETQLVNLDNGIKWIYKQCSLDAFDIQSHILFDASDVTLGGGFVINPNNKEERALSNVEYFAAGRDTLTYIEENFDFEGNLYDVFDIDSDGTRYAIISETAANSKILKIDVGDTIKIAKFVDITKDPSRQQGLTGKRYTEFYLEYGIFEYETYKVCAIIKDMPTSDNLPVYLDPEHFTELTGKEEVYTEVAVYVNTELESGEISSLTDTLRRWCADFAKVEWHNAVAESRIERESRDLAVLDAISIVILILSPIFWFFSQIMFYKRRNREFELIRGMGAVEKEIKKIFLFDGLIMALLGMVSTVVFSSVGIWLIHQINMKWVSRLNLSSRVLYSFEMPWIELAISIGLTAICGFLASYIPYRINKKQSSLTKSREFSGDE